MSLELDGEGLARELRAAVEERLAQASEAARSRIAPRLEEVTSLLSQLLLLRLERGETDEPGELERTLRVRWSMLVSALELHAVDALQDSLERTVARLVRAGFSALLRV